MIRSATLEFIASKCDEYFIPLEPLTLIEINKVYEFIKTELYKDEITRGIDFEHFQDAFNRTISKTLNRQAFVDSEINAVRNMLGGGLATWYKQSPINQYKIFNDIQKLVLIDKNEYEIFSHYYIKYIIQERSFCKLVSIVHSYGLIKYLCFLEGEPLKKEHSQQTKTNKLKAPVIALFCNLVSECKLIQKEDSESVKNYCIRICKEFNLIYSDRVRQNFNGSETKENKRKIKELILPVINDEAKNKLTEHLKSKEPSKQKLYG